MGAYPYKRQMKKVTTSTFRKMKGNEKITMITAYDYPTAKIVDEAGIDSILVGDSLGMTILGYDSTVYVTMDDMLHHTKAVTRGASRALVIADMPFLSYNTGERDALINAGRLISEGGAGAVKLEGGKRVCPVIKAMTDAGIPVCGHIGLTPQSVLQFGGNFIQGKTDETAQRLIDDAKALEEAGVFAIVAECVPHGLGKMITESVSVPVIGIGAGVDCDGQVLVIHDLIGMYQGRTPSFVKQYAQVNPIISDAVSSYVNDVKQSVFPDEEHWF